MEVVDSTDASIASLFYWKDYAFLKLIICITKKLQICSYITVLQEQQFIKLDIAKCILKVYNQLS